MHRKILALVLCFTLFLGVTPAFAAGEAEVPTAAVVIDGIAAEGLEAYLYDGTAYLSLPRTAQRLRPDASYAWEEDRVVVRGEGLVLSAKVGHVYLECNGRYLYLPKGVKQLENGDTLVAARVLAKALGSQVIWDGSVCLTSGGTALTAGDAFYDPQAVDLMARVIVHESGQQPFLGQIAVGNVIMNRVKSPSFPDTIYAVVYERNQFPGATSRAPDTEAIIAAKLCLDGAVVLDNAYYFNGVGESCWAARNKTLVSVIGGHAFYG